MKTGSSLSWYGWLLCAWTLITPFQYGFHISILNQLHDVLTCNHPGASSTAAPGYHLPTCIPMDDFTFSAVTSVYTVGGFVGSIVANVLMDRWGRKGATRASSASMVLGTGIMAGSGSVAPMVLGRFFVGLGAGLGLCVGPIFLSELAPEKIRGSVGVLLQLATVLGIFFTQLLGLNLATPDNWRYVIVFSLALGCAQWLLAPFATDTPLWLKRKNRRDESEQAAKRIWGAVLRRDDDDEDAASLLSSRASTDTLASHARINSEIPPLTVPSLLLTLIRPMSDGPRLNVYRPTIIICFAMLTQQLCGINAILYYSNDILKKAMPDQGPYVSLWIAVVNVIMTFPPIVLIEKLGRKTLLLISATGALISICIVAIALDQDMVWVTSVGIVVFVMSFAIGLGPVPFVMIPEVSPPYAVSALSSLALGLNWMANFLVGLVFLPLRNSLSGGDANKEGRVFWVFAASIIVCMGVVRGDWR